MGMKVLWASGEPGERTATAERATITNVKALAGHRIYDECGVG